VEQEIILGVYDPPVDWFSDGLDELEEVAP
jgi:hypothetical protein